MNKTTLIITISIIYTVLLALLNTCKLLYCVSICLGILIVEMTLFILRSVRMEDAFENNHEQKQKLR